MAVVPDTHDFTGGVATSSEANSFIRDPITFLLNPPRAELRQTSAQTFTTSTTTAVQFNAEDVDTDVDGVGGHDNVTLNTRFTAQFAGWYRISGAVEFVANATGDRFAWWMVNGADVNGSVGFQAGDATASATVAARSKLVYLNVGDYLELVGFQSSGGNLNTVASGRDQSTMSVLWVSN